MEQKTDDNGFPFCHSIEGSVFGIRDNNDDSSFDSNSDQDTNQKFNSQVNAPKCKLGMALLMENFVKTVNFNSGQFLTNIQFEVVDPLDELSLFLEPIMKRLCQLCSYVGGYSKPHAADAITFFEHFLLQESKALRAKFVSGPLEEANKQIKDLKSKLEELN
jgi:hypothetical protein